jgi:hypothetical protein
MTDNFQNCDSNINICTIVTNLYPCKVIFLGFCEDIVGGKGEAILDPNYLSTTLWRDFVSGDIGPIFLTPALDGVVNFKPRPPFERKKPPVSIR